MNVLLRVRSAARSLDFYRALGFEEQMLLRDGGRLYYGEMILRDPRGGALMFLERDRWAIDEDRDGEQDGSGQVLYLPVDDVDAVRARLPDGAVVQGPRDEYYGRELVIRDPDGFRIAFIQVWPGGERLPEGVEAWKRPAG
ncbi:MAG TPA: VOC family protein [Kofleriaceae bacterium]|nr:VOC family protein [Kofleriaceae bacterium]